MKTFIAEEDDGYFYWIFWDIMNEIFIERLFEDVSIYYFLYKVQYFRFWNNKINTKIANKIKSLLTQRD